MPPVTPQTLSRAAARLYEQWEHLEVDGEAEGYPWAVLAAALARPIDGLYDMLAAAEHPWAPAFDPELAAELMEPEHAALLFDWLGQFVGVKPRSDLSAAGHRLRLSETGNFNVGTPGAIVGAARQRAIGPDGTPESATVILVERIGGDPYHFAVTMYASEVADADATKRDIDAQTPAGRRGTDPATRFDFNLVTGGDYATLTASWPTYGDVSAAFATYADLTAHPSGL